MLRFVGGLVTLVVASVALLVVVPTVAFAACPPGEREVHEVDRFGVITTGCEEIPGHHTPSPTPTADPDKDGSQGSGSGPEVCRSGGQEVDCVTWAGRWNGSCYVRLVQDPPDFSDSVWEGERDGYIVECTPEACVTTSEAQGEMHCLSTSRYWVARPPEGAGPLPRELAERAVAQMDVDMGQIGSTPPSTTVKDDSIGIVGMPIWLWVSNPGENTTGPITRSDSEGDVSVTATGTLDRTEWTLAEDGEVYSTTTCSGSNAPGTKWSEAVMGPEVRHSPTCGFTAAENRRAGNITLTGTAYWTVEWTGGGQLGTIEVPGQVRSTPLTIGEAQVLTQ